MVTPAPRTPVRLARGSKTNLDAGLAAGDILEGELVYAKNEDTLYMVEGGVFVSAGGGGGTGTGSIRGDGGDFTSGTVGADFATNVYGGGNFTATSTDEPVEFFGAMDAGSFS